eukprot:scaffold245331_cov48-Attheya_sp.AAC.5
MNSFSSPQKSKKGGSLMFDTSECDLEYRATVRTTKRASVALSSPVRSRRVKKTKEIKSDVTRKVGEGCFAVLAVVELISCCSKLPFVSQQSKVYRYYVQQLFQATEPTSPHISVSEPKFKPFISWALENVSATIWETSKVFCSSTIVPSLENGIEEEEIHYSSRSHSAFSFIRSKWMHWRQSYFNTWHDMVNHLFTLALLIHACIETWRSVSRIIQKQKRKLRRQKKKRKLPRKSLLERVYKKQWHHINRYHIEFGLFFLLLLVSRLAILPFLREKRANGSNGEGVTILALHPFIFVAEQFNKMKKEMQASETRGSVPATYSLGEKIFARLATWCNFAAKAKLREKCREAIMALVTMTLTKPLVMQWRIRQAFTFVHWVKYMAPLLSTCNKLRKHICDFMTKWHQRRRSRIAQNAWKQLLCSMSEEQRKEAAILRIQSIVRAKRDRKKMRYIIYMQEMKEMSAAKKIQARLRARAAHAKSSLQRSKALSNRINARNGVNIKESCIKDDTRRLEYIKRTQGKKRLLLRPNTTFAVVWKTFAITCVDLEVLTFLLSPYIIGHLGKLPLDHLLVTVFESGTLRCRKSVTTSTGLVEYIRNASHLFTNNRLERLGSTKNGLRISACNQFSSDSVRFVSRILVSLVGIISLADVFVTFFTGELAENSGILVPKPYVQRWIFPGLIYQLIANPAMRDILLIVKSILRFAKDVGPTRCAHIILAISPLIRVAANFLLEKAMYLVGRQNRNVVLSGSL